MASVLLLLFLSLSGPCMHLMLSSPVNKQELAHVEAVESAFKESPVISIKVPEVKETREDERHQQQEKSMHNEEEGENLGEEKKKVVEGELDGERPKRDSAELAGGKGSEEEEKGVSTSSSSLEVSRMLALVGQAFGAPWGFPPAIPQQPTTINGRLAFGLPASPFFQPMMMPSAAGQAIQSQPLVPQSPMFGPNSPNQQQLQFPGAQQQFGPWQQQQQQPFWPQQIIPQGTWPQPFQMTVSNPQQDQQQLTGWPQQQAVVPLSSVTPQNIQQLLLPQNQAQQPFWSLVQPSFWPQQQQAPAAIGGDGTQRIFLANQPLATSVVGTGQQQKQQQPTMSSQVARSQLMNPSIAQLFGGGKK